MGLLKYTRVCNTLSGTLTNILKYTEVFSVPFIVHIIYIYYYCYVCVQYNVSDTVHRVAGRSPWRPTTFRCIQGVVPFAVCWTGIVPCDVCTVLTYILYI